MPDLPSSILPCLWLIAALIMGGLPDRLSGYCRVLGLLMAGGTSGLLLIARCVPESFAAVAFPVHSVLSLSTIWVVVAMTVVALPLISDDRDVAALLWNAGLVWLASVASNVLFAGLLLILASFPDMFWLGGQREGPISSPDSKLLTLQDRLRSLLAGVRQGFRTSPAKGMGLLLLIMGLIGAAVSRSQEAGLTGSLISVLLLCGIGGILGWFPFPRVSAAGGVEAGPAAVLFRTLLPVMIAARVVWLWLESSGSGVDSFHVVLVVALFSLALCILRQSREPRLSCRLSLLSLTTLSLLALAGAIHGWAARNGEYAGWSRLGFPAHDSLWASILICETVGLLAVLCGHGLLNPDGPGGDLTENLPGSFRKRPAAALLFSLGLLSLSGVPPLPGFWCRLLLASGLLLPHVRLNVTGQLTMHPSFLRAVLVFLFFWLAGSLLQLRLVGSLLFNDPFRLRRGDSHWSRRVAGGLCGLLFAFTGMLPYSLGPLLARPETIEPPRPVPLRPSPEQIPDEEAPLTPGAGRAV